MHPNSTPAIKRFNSKVCKSANGCWLWVGSTDKDGYGIMWAGKELGKEDNIGAHRAAWMLHRGPIPDGQFVLHRCDRPTCVNPDHLFIGDAKANSEDMIAKGRFSNGNQKGNKNAIRKLNAPKVRAIRALYKFGHGWSQDKLAREYGVSQQVISSLIRRKTWADIT